VPEINLIIRAIEEHRTKLQNLTLGFSWSDDLRKIIIPLSELHQTLQLLDGILDTKPEFVRRRYDRAETSIKEALDFVIERINERVNSRDTSAFQYGPFNCLSNMDNALVFLLNALSKVNNEYKAEQPSSGHAETEQNAISSKLRGIATCFGKILEKVLYIFTKSFWDSLWERMWPK